MATSAEDGRFVGRDAEITELTACLAAAGDGSGGLVLVSGPAGIGKTRTVEVGTATVAVVAWGRCVDDPGAPPLWPWRRILRARPDVGSTVSEMLAAVDLAGDQGGDLEAARFRLVAATTDVLLRSAAADRLVVVLEDLHWADEMSLRLLRHLAGELADSRLLVIGTYRDPAGPGSERLHLTLPELLRCPGSRTMRLGPLTEDAVRAYLGGRSLPPDAARIAHRRSGGNPLYLRVIVAASRSTPDDPIGGGPELRHLVRTTIASLAPATLDLLDTASVLGEEIDADRLAAICGRAAVDVHAGLDAAVRAGVLTALPEAPGRRRFVHAIVRDAIYDDLSPSNREELHRRAAETLECLAADDGDLAGLVAGHWLRAAGTHALERAVSWSRRAADGASRMLAFDEAARFLALALGAAQQISTSDGDTAELLVELATAEFHAGRFASAMRHAISASDLAATCDRSDLQAAAALTVHDVAMPDFQSDLLRMCDRGLATVDAGSQPALRSRLLSQAASALADLGRSGPAGTLSGEALELAERCQNPGAMVDAIRARMKAVPTALGAPEQLRLGLLAIEHSRTVGQPLATLWGAKWRIDAGLELGDLAVVDDELSRVTALARSTRLPLVRWHDRRLHASVAALRGQFAEAFAADDEALEIGSAELSDDLTARGMSAAFHLQHALVIGEPPAWAPEAAALLDHAGDIPVVQVAAALVALLRGDRHAAAAAYEGMHRRLADRDFLAGAGVGLHLVPLIEEFHDVAVAGSLASHIAMRPYAASGAGVYCSGSIAELLGRLAVVRGDPDEAADRFGQALAVDTATGARPAAVNDRIALARVLLDRGGPGDVVRATATVRTAPEESRRLGMPVREKQALALVDRAARAARTADPLTPREREIAGLVAGALTNRQIAERLFLSERTVESHVHSVLAKLGLANRTQIATTFPAR